MELNYRKKLIRLATFLGGIYFFLEFVLPKFILEKVGVADYHDQISYGFIVFGAMAIGLGIINLFMSHGSKILFQRKEWQFSVVLLLGLVVMMTSTGLEWMQSLEVSSEVRSISSLADFSDRIVSDSEKAVEGVPTTSVRAAALVNATKKILEHRIDPSLSESIVFEESDTRYKLVMGYQQELKLLKIDVQEAVAKVSLDGAIDKEAYANISEKLNLLASTYGKLLRLQTEISFVSELYGFLYTGLFVSLGSAMFSLLGVYIAAAAYRAFRVRSFESALMMTAAVIVMLGQIPFGLYISDSLPEWRLWLLEVPNSAAFRAIKIGATIAGLIMAFRMWLSIESESFTETSS